MRKNGKCFNEVNWHGEWDKEILCFLITFGKLVPMGLAPTTSKQKILYIFVFFQQLHLI